MGVAISASLLPPAVNSGLLFGYSLLAVARPTVGDHYAEVVNRTMRFNSLPTLINCTKFVDNDYLPLYSCNMAREASQLAVYSFIITLINIACIFLMATIVLQIKDIVPIIPDKKIGNCFWNRPVRISARLDFFSWTLATSIGESMRHFKQWGSWWQCPRTDRPFENSPRNWWTSGICHLVYWSSSRLTWVIPSSFELFVFE